MGNGGKDMDQKTRKKPGRVPTSCAECRRLKLRCDRNVPCEKCVSRGCGSICPEGSLTPGRGNRMILANTEELHAQIESQSERVRQLESQLRSMQTMMSMRPDSDVQLFPVGERFRDSEEEGEQRAGSTARVVNEKRSDVEGCGGGREGRDGDGGRKVKKEDTVIDAFGTLTIGERGESRFLGKTARSEYLIFAPPRTGREQLITLPRLSHRLTQTSFPESEVMDKTGLVREALSMLPPLSEAVRLCEVYLEYGRYLYTPVPKNELFDEILTVIYRACHDPNSFAQYHPLALLFIIFALASFFDPTKDPMPIVAKEWFYLSRAALQLASPVKETTLISVQCMIHMAQYLDFIDTGASGNNEAWMYIGHAIRLGHSIGLHINGTRWKLDEDTVERRNRVFWPLFVLDTWSSFYFGRPPGTSMVYIDCAMPKDKEEKILPDGTVLPTFRMWHTKFTALLHTLLSTSFGPNHPSYEKVLELDRKIRDFPVPTPWRPTCYDGVPSKTLETWIILFMRESTLLNLHRACFAQALQEMPHDLSKHKYIPSVVAIYRSAWRISRSLDHAWNMFEFLCCRLNLWWSQALSAAIVMSLIVTKAPISLLAQPALEELNFIVKVFEKAELKCIMAARLLSPLKRISRKAQEVLGRASPHTHTLDDSPITPAELDRLGGKTHLLLPTDDEYGGFHAPGTNSVQVLSNHSTSGPATGTTPLSRSTSLTLSDAFFDPFANLHLPPQILHPTIVQDMRNFAVRNESGPSPVIANSFFDLPSMGPALQDTIIGTLEQQLTSEAQEQQRVGRIHLQPERQASGIHSGREMYLDHPPQQTPAGVGAGGLVLDSTWQSFVEQLGF